jgi:ferredoxin
MRPGTRRQPVTAGPSSWSVLNQGSTISVSPGKCRRVRLRTSTCRRCVEICPDDAITLDPGPQISDTCTECGLCVRACPTEVFESALYRDEYLLDQAISHLDNSPARGGPKMLSIRCERADSPIAGAVRVSCLGTVGKNVLFGAALAGFNEVTLIRGSCSRCHLKPAEDLVRDSIRRAGALARGAGLGEISFVTVKREKVTRAPVGRREMFADIADRVRTGVRAVSPGGEGSFREQVSREPGLRRDDGAGGSPGRTFLRTLLRGESWEGACPTAFDNESPWARVTVDEDGCTACGICVSVCPTDAIEITERGENQVLLLRPSACTNCSLCREACIEGVLDYSNEIRIADILQDQAEVIATIKPAWCAICGDVIPAGMGETCLTCERRQVSAAHLKG